MSSHRAIVQSTSSSTSKSTTQSKDRYLTPVKQELLNNIMKDNFDCIVSFRKVSNDSKRIMKISEFVKSYTPKNSDTKLMIVYDSEKKGYRSFYLDRVKAFTIC